MKVIGDIKESRKERWSDPSLSWGLVPTMGYLHEGHLSLVRRARSENQRLVVSIFVNPKQFGSSRDLGSYPKDIDRDLRLLAEEKVDLVFIPPEREMYPPGHQTFVTVEHVTRGLEGSARPGHFIGVATVVAKLFNIFDPTRAYFGQKDAQQSVVIQRMAADLNFDVEIVECPIIREPDGLAMSSRNIRLTEKQRAAAPMLYRALSAAGDDLISGELNPNVLRQTMEKIILTEPLALLDYASVADPQTLEELEKIEDRALLSLAVFFGEVRLIDNIKIVRRE